MTKRRKDSSICTSSAITEIQIPTLKLCGIHYPISKEAHDEAQIIQRTMSTATSMSRLSRRSKATVSEECYASGVVKLVEDRTSGLEISDRRKKTSRGSSGDKDPMEADGFMKEALRAGGPQLCGMLVLTFPVPQGSGHPMHVAITNEAQISHGVVCMLEERNIQVEAILFCLRQSQFDCDSACLTLFIQATKARQDNYRKKLDNTARLQKGPWPL